MKNEITTEFFDKYVPQSPYINLEWRKDLYYRADRDKGLQRDLALMCQADPLFWQGAFCWAIDPRRPRGQRRVPFVPRPNQWGFILGIEQALAGNVKKDGEEGTTDVIAIKARAQGGSYMPLK